ARSGLGVHPPAEAGGALAIVRADALKPAAAQLPREDRLGDPLPAHALARLGTDRFRLDSPIIASAVSPDGRLLAVVGSGVRSRASATSSLLTWNTETGRALWRLRAAP